MLAAHAASADPQVILPQGLPVQVKPTFTEPGLPQFTFPTSGGSLLGGSADTGTGNGGGGDGSTSPGGGSTAGSGDAYNTMMAQSWGSSAANAAGAMGVSATALAATCAMESNCQNVGSSGGSSATGAFQMISSTYNADIKAPWLTILALPGQLSPEVRARWILRRRLMRRRMSCAQDALTLQQNDGISDPTVLQTRAMYQFGGSVGPDVADATRFRQYCPTHWVERCIVGGERSEFVEHCGSVAPDDCQ